MYIAETEQDWWYQIPYDKVDVMYLGPAGIQRDDGGNFGLLPALKDRFSKVVSKARAMNPAIKIVVSQWWGTGQERVWGEDLSQIRGSSSKVHAYAQSVANFIREYGLDGYDVDYESSNVIPDMSELISSVRSALDSTKSGLLLTLSPASTSYLTSENLKHVDYINMQSYAGGRGIGVSAYTSLGFPSTSLHYGICPETNCYGDSVETACSMVRSNNLGGVHVYRLNSDNYAHEDQTQETMYTKIHNGECATTYNASVV